MTALRPGQSSIPVLYLIRSAFVKDGAVFMSGLLLGKALSELTNANPPLPAGEARTVMIFAPH